MQHSDSQSAVALPRADPILRMQRASDRPVSIYPHDSNNSSTGELGEYDNSVDGYRLPSVISGPRAHVARSPASGISRLVEVEGALISTLRAGERRNLSSYLLRKRAEQGLE